MLNWETLISSTNADRWIKGRELERCFPEGFRHRFAIGRETFDGKEHMAYDVRYRVRDVEAAGDQHFKDGKPAPIFGEYATLDEALAAIEPHRIPIEEYAK
jgi:hypothetical protein